MTAAAQDRSIRHGTVTGYTHGKCRDACCRTAHTQYGANRSRLIAYGRWMGLVDSAGTRRRAQALCTLGWGFAFQARQIGMSKDNYTKTVRDTRKVSGRTAAAVARIYEQLSGTWAPDTPHTRRIRTLATRAGYPPPLAWDDDTIDDPVATPQGVDFTGQDIVRDWVAVERVCSGEAALWAYLCDDDRREVVARLLLPANGWTRSRIARYLHQSGETIARYIPEVHPPAEEKAA